MKSEEDVYELIDICSQFELIEKIHLYDPSRPEKDGEGYAFSGWNELTDFHSERYFKEGRLFFQESEISGAEDICVVNCNKERIETGTFFESDKGTFIIVGTVRSLIGSGGKEYKYNVFLPYTTYLKSVGIPTCIELVFDNQIGIQAENQIIQTIKSRWPGITVQRSAQFTIPMNYRSEVATVFVFIIATLLALSMAVNYFDEKNISNDSILRLTGASRSLVVIYSFITRCTVVLFPAALALFAHWLVISKINDSFIIFGKILKYSSKDYLTIFALLFVSACIAMLPYTVRLYVRSARDFAVKRE